MKKKGLAIIIAIVLAVLMTCAFAGCSVTTSTGQDINNTLGVGNRLAANQPTPTDIEYSLERYNLIRRAYWVNGQREKAISLPCPVTKPLGYIVLMTQSGAVVGRFVVDGKVTSLNSYLTPDSEYYEGYNNTSGINKWLPDVDGSYGYNQEGIFFFTTNGNYIEWTGIYLYSDIPFQVDDPVIKVEGNS